MTLEVQKYLNVGSLDGLTNEFGIVSNHHDTEPLVILNYDQIESPKTHPIVRECRGLVLEKNTWRVVAKSFNRFFNLNETPDIHKNFNWSKFTCAEKLDGSLILLYYYKGWRFNTRGSWANGEINGWNKTWREVIDEIVNIKPDTHIALNPNYTYVLELCSVYNKVVTYYPTPTLYHLTTYDNNTLEELPDLTSPIFPKAPLFSFSSLDEILQYVNSREGTFEGVVLRDSNGMRIKIKNPKYLELHKIKGNGNIARLDNLIVFILDNETDELLSYFPEVQEQVDKYAPLVKSFCDNAVNVYNENRHIENQKEFALKVKDTPYAPLCFTARKTGKNVDMEIFKRFQEHICQTIERLT